MGGWGGAAMFEDFRFPSGLFEAFVCVRVGTTSRHFPLHFSLPAISQVFVSLDPKGFRIFGSKKVFVSFGFASKRCSYLRIQKGFRIFWVRIKKVFLPLGFSSKRFSSIQSINNANALFTIHHPPPPSTSTMMTMSVIILS